MFILHGFFVTKNCKTEYRHLGLSLHPNVDNVCYFEMAYWIRNKLGYADIGRIWYKRHGYTMFAGKAKIKDDKSILDFLQSLEPDGWYHFYVVHGGDDRGEEISKKKDKKKMPKKDVANDIDIDDDVCILGDDLGIDKGEVGEKVGGDVEIPSGPLKMGPTLKDKVVNVSLHSNPRFKTQTTT